MPREWIGSLPPSRIPPSCLHFGPDPRLPVGSMRLRKDGPSTHFRRAVETQSRTDPAKSLTLTPFLFTLSSWPLLFFNDRLAGRRPQRGLATSPQLHSGRKAPSLGSTLAPGLIRGIADSKGPLGRWRAGKGRSKGKQAACGCAPSPWLISWAFAPLSPSRIASLSRRLPSHWLMLGPSKLSSGKLRTNFKWMRGSEKRPV